MKAAVTPPKTMVLVVSPDPNDCLVLGQILGPDHWRLRHAATCEQACALLKHNRCHVVISEAKAAGHCWRKLLAAIHSMPENRQPKLIVASPQADDALWAEVLNDGGYNVLVKPFEPAEVQWVMQSSPILQ